MGGMVVMGNRLVEGGNSTSRAADPRMTRLREFNLFP